MVEEKRQPDPPGRPPASWIRGLLTAGLGLAAVAEFLLGLRPGRRPSPAQAAETAPPVEPAVDGPAEIRHPDGRIEHPSVRHERGDASFRWILVILIGAMGFAALVHYVLLQFFYDYRGYEAAIKKSPYALAPTPSERLPPEPRLEPLDRTSGIESSNIYVRLADKEAILNSYGTTGQKGFVHIPIDRAMTYLENKLPARPEPAANQWRQDGLVDAGESNSGRMFRGQPKWYEH